MAALFLGTAALVGIFWLLLGARRPLALGLTVALAAGGLLFQFAASPTWPGTSTARSADLTLPIHVGGPVLISPNDGRGVLPGDDVDLSLVAPYTAAEVELELTDSTGGRCSDTADLIAEDDAAALRRDPVKPATYRMVVTAADPASRTVNVRLANSDILAGCPLDVSVRVLRVE